MKIKFLTMALIFSFLQPKSPDISYEANEYKAEQLNTVLCKQFLKKIHFNNLCDIFDSNALDYSISKNSTNLTFIYKNIRLNFNISEKEKKENEIIKKLLDERNETQPANFSKLIYQEILKLFSSVKMNFSLEKKTSIVISYLGKTLYISNTCPSNITPKCFFQEDLSTDICNKNLGFIYKADKNDYNIHIPFSSLEEGVKDFSLIKIIIKHLEQIKSNFNFDQELTKKLQEKLQNDFKTMQLNAYRIANSNSNQIYCSTAYEKITYEHYINVNSPEISIIRRAKDTVILDKMIETIKQNLQEIENLQTIEQTLLKTDK